MTYTCVMKHALVMQFISTKLRTEFKTFFIHYRPCPVETRTAIWTGTENTSNIKSIIKKNHHIFGTLELYTTWVV